MAETDRDAVNAVLARHPHESPAEFGFYRVYFDDVDTEFNGDGLDGKEPFTSCAFHIRGLCPELITFVFDVSKAGNMVIFNAQGEDTPERPVMIYSHPEQAQHVPKDMYKNPALCTSGVEYAIRSLPRLDGLSRSSDPPTLTGEICYATRDHLLYRNSWDEDSRAEEFEHIGPDGRPLGAPRVIWASEKLSILLGAHAMWHQPRHQRRKIFPRHPQCATHRLRIGLVQSNEFEEKLQKKQTWRFYKSYQFGKVK